MQKRLFQSVAASIVFFASSASVAPQVHAQAVVEQVAAVINEEALLLSEVRERAAPFLIQAMRQPNELGRLQAIQEIMHQVLDRMVDEKLLIQAARAADITVGDAQVEAAIRNVQTQAGLTGDDFWQALEQQGMNREQYRVQVRNQLLQYQLLNQRARNRVNITEEEVRRRYEEMVVQARRTSRFSAAHILIPVSPTASATELRIARQRAEQIAAPLHNADDFELAMEEHGGSDLGTLSQGDLEPDLERALLTMEPGQVSAPVRGGPGYFIFLLRSRALASDSIGSFESVRDRVYGQMMQEAMGRQERLLLEELRRAAIIDRRLFE